MLVKKGYLYQNLENTCMDTYFKYIEGLRKGILKYPNFYKDMHIQSGNMLLLWQYPVINYNHFNLDINNPIFEKNC